MDWDPVQVGIGRCLEETTFLLLIVFVPSLNSAWIPKAVISQKSEVKKLGEVGKVYIEDWWLEDHDNLHKV